MPETNAARGGNRTATQPQSDAAIGMTEWKRRLVADAVASYHRHLKPPKPMVAIRNLSPEFLELAISLDTLLADYRDKFGRAWLLRRYCERKGVPMEVTDRLGRTLPHPELERIERIAEQASAAIPEMIRTIENTKAVRYADRNLKKRAGELRNDHYWRRLDWVEILYEHDLGERR